MPAPLWTLDIEASSLEEGGYPIEIALVSGVGGTVALRFATLIKPRTAWLSKGHWSAASAAVHGIKQEELNHGLDADQVCTVLTQTLAGRTVICDGGSYDAYWLEQLFDGAPLPFALDHLSMVGVQEFRALKDAQPPAHRALPDAEWLFHAISGLHAKAGDTR